VFRYAYSIQAHKVSLGDVTLGRQAHDNIDSNKTTGELKKHPVKVIIFDIVNYENILCR
jgi:hypothetical protein